MDEEKTIDDSENEPDVSENPEMPPSDSKPEIKVSDEGNSVFNPTEEPTEFGNDSIQTVTQFETPAGSIGVVHDITLGDLLISTILMALLIFNVLNQLIRRF